jgi:hypothetical protein
MALCRPSAQLNAHIHVNNGPCPAAIRRNLGIGNEFLAAPLQRIQLDAGRTRDFTPNLNSFFAAERKRHPLFCLL